MIRFGTRATCAMCAALSLAAVPLHAQDAERDAEPDNLDVTMRLLPEGATRPDAVTRVIEIPEALRERARRGADEPGPADEARGGDPRNAQGREPGAGGQPGGANGAGEAARDAARGAAEQLRDARDVAREMAEEAREARENVGRGRPGRDVPSPEPPERGERPDSAGPPERPDSGGPPELPDSAAPPQRGNVPEQGDRPERPGAPGRP